MQLGCVRRGLLAGIVVEPFGVVAGWAPSHPASPATTGGTPPPPVAMWRSALSVVRVRGHGIGR